MTEEERQQRFPVCREQIYLAHAGVTALPHCVAKAMADYSYDASLRSQEFTGVLRDVKKVRELSAQLIGGNADEIALLGPTSLGLSLFANGMPWQEGDEVLCYQGDY